MRQERRENFPAEIQPGVAAEFTAPRELPSYISWPWCTGPSPEKLCRCCVFGFDRFVDSDGAVNVFRSKAVYQHGGNSKRLGSEDFIHGLLLPERVVTPGCPKVCARADLFEAMTAAKFSGGTGLQIQVVVVVVLVPPVSSFFRVATCS